MRAVALSLAFYFLRATERGSNGGRCRLGVPGRCLLGVPAAIRGRRARSRRCGTPDSPRRGARCTYDVSYRQLAVLGSSRQHRRDHNKDGGRSPRQRSENAGYAPHRSPPEPKGPRSSDRERSRCFFVGESSSSFFDAGRVVAVNADARALADVPPVRLDVVVLGVAAPEARRRVVRLCLDQRRDVLLRHIRRDRRRRQLDLGRLPIAAVARAVGYIRGGETGAQEKSAPTYNARARFTPGR